MDRGHDGQEVQEESLQEARRVSGRMVMIGFGSIGQGVLPLIFRHIDIKPEQITIISEDDRGGLKETKRFGVTFIRSA
jgi:homospermidine synthase